MKSSVKKSQFALKVDNDPNAFSRKHQYLSKRPPDIKEKDKHIFKNLHLLKLKKFSN